MNERSGPDHPGDGLVLSGIFFFTDSVFSVFFCSFLHFFGFSHFFCIFRSISTISPLPSRSLAASIRSIPDHSAVRNGPIREPLWLLPVCNRHPNKSDQRINVCKSGRRILSMDAAPTNVAHDRQFDDESFPE